MHEMHLLKDILNKIDQIIEENKSVKATEVSIWLGALSHISAEHLTEHFIHESKGRSCEGAKLEVEQSNDISHPQAQDILLKSIHVE